jgi:hypothetical protein
VRPAYRALLFSVVAAFFVGALIPTPALAQRTWTEGTPTQPFSIGLVDGVRAGTLGGSPAVLLERRLLWQYHRPDVSIFDPFSVESLANGNVLIADRTNVAVTEVNHRGQIVWAFTKADDPRLVQPYSAQRLVNGNTLICDRRADFVIEVTPDKRVVWQYGAVQNSLSPGSVMDPYSATRVSNGNTLICDNRFGARVIEIRSSDYDPAKPNLGYTADSVVWRYGRDNDPGVGPGQLASPRKAERLPNGNTLIADSEDNEATGDRVLEVTPQGQIAWQCGGGSLISLEKPSAVHRLANGNTLIAEEESGRVLEITPPGDIVDLYAGNEFLPENGALSKVRDVSRSLSGTTLVADQADQRIVEFGYSTTGILTSAGLSLGLPGVKKSIESIAVVADNRAGTSVTIAYSLDDGPWIEGGESIDLPTGTTATELRYRVSLKGSPTTSPVLRQVSIVYDVASGGDDDGGNTGPPPSQGGSDPTSQSTTQGVSPNTDGHASNGSHVTNAGSDRGTRILTGGSAKGVGSGSTEGTSTGAPGDPLGTAATAVGGRRFASGTLMSEVGGTGGDGLPASGGSGGNTMGALALLGICYVAGLTGASVNHGSTTSYVHLLATRLGRR